MIQPFWMWYGGGIGGRLGGNLSRYSNGDSRAKQNDQQIAI